jgi:hypothetical protein
MFSIYEPALRFYTWKRKQRACFRMPHDNSAYPFQLRAICPHRFTDTYTRIVQVQCQSYASGHCRLGTASYGVVIISIYPYTHGICTCTYNNRFRRTWDGLLVHIVDLELHTAATISLISPWQHFLYMYTRVNVRVRARAHTHTQTLSLSHTHTQRV